MRVADEHDVRALDLRDGEADRVVARRAIEIGVEEIDMPLIGNLVIGVAEPAQERELACAS